MNPERKAPVTARTPALCLGLALLGLACSAPAPGAFRDASPRARAPGFASNILRGDYAGSAACSGCHAKQFAALQHSPMQRMTRDIHHAELNAPFDHAEFKFKGDRATMESAHGERFVRLQPRAGEPELFRVSKVIGGRYREDFVGEEVDPDSPFGAAIGVQRILPVSYLIFDRSWRYKGYSVLLRERPSMTEGLVWQRACILCHNTSPALSSLLDNLYGQGAPTYQGSASEELPPERQLRYVVDDEQALRAALGQELAAIGAPSSLPSDSQQAALNAAIKRTRENFAEKDLIELGIGCEACHGGSRAHAQRPREVRPTFALSSTFLHVTSAQGKELTHAEELNRRCAQCHTVLFSRYPYTWEGGMRAAHAGGSSINSGEARDFLLGGCSHALECTSCHDPHGEDDRQKLERLGGVEGNELCTHCHSELAPADAQRRHSHHESGGPGSFCLDCHMPKKNMGLQYELTRYHRIGSPTDRERVEGDRPLECALCHTDKSVEQITLTMEKLWNKHYDRDKLRRLYGHDLQQNTILLTLLGGKPHERAVAMAVAARDRVPGTLPLIVDGLENDYPLVRYFARHSLEKRFGEPIPLDMSADGPDLALAAKQWIETHAATAR